MLAATVPGLQGEQALMPGDAAANPGGQAEHVAAPNAAKVPGLQFVQEPENAEGNWPAGQARPQPAMPVAVDVEPTVCGAQAVHWLEPIAAANCVAGQGEQLDEPGVEAKRPGMHGVQLARAPSEKVPTGHA